MFSNSTQKRFWIFSSEKKLSELRKEANEKYILKAKAKISKDPIPNFLNAEEEETLLRMYENHLKEFCSKFYPKMPKPVMTTAFAYFKRFYLHNSVMDYHPKEILVTCVYLACKVEEFNLTLGQFLMNVKGDRNKAADIVLNNEPVLMVAMNFHLTIHDCYRPFEGLLLDIKTRFPDYDPECIRKAAEDFLDRALLSDACLLFCPSQIALASVLHAASKVKRNLDLYVTSVLLAGSNVLPQVIETIKSVRGHVRSRNTDIDVETLKKLNKKLDGCRNEENNPDTKIYQKKMQEEMDAE